MYKPVQIRIGNQTWEGEVMSVERERPVLPPVFGQCWDAWAQRLYSLDGSLTFCQAGCLVTAFASFAAWTGYDVNPLTAAERLAEAGAFSGDLLAHPSRVSQEFPALAWHGPGDGAYYSTKYEASESSFIDWRKRAVDLALLEALLIQQPIIVEVDVRPQTSPIDQHFVLAVEYHPAADDGIEDDLTVMDPLSGTYTSILTYFNQAWMREQGLQSGAVSKVARTVTGARVWEFSPRVREEGESANG